MSSYLVLFQPLSLRKAAGGWGSYDLWEWGGRTVSPHPHAHSTHCWLHYGRKNLHALSNSRPHDFAVHLHAWTIFCLLVSHTSIFLVFPTDAASWEPCSFIHDLLCCCGSLTHSVFRCGFLCLGTESFILTHKQLLVGLTHSKLRAVLPLSPTISCRESFHA